MKWIIITGTWRLTNKEVEADVRKKVKEIFERGDGIVTGGATGVDFFAMDEFVKLNPTCSHIRTFIPAKLDHYIADYKKNWMHAPVNESDIDNLSHLLNLIKERNPASVFEVRKENGDITQDEYNLRHNEEVTFADRIVAFRVNDSFGTSDTIKKAQNAGLVLEDYKEYKIEE
jgi:hypothetical protein